MTLVARGKLQLELRDLRELHSTIEWSLTGLAGELECLPPGTRSETMDSLLKICRHPADLPQRLLPEYLANRLRGRFSREFRSTIFVRLISSLEVFLLETVQELFASYPELFITDRKISITHKDALALTSLAQLRTLVLLAELQDARGRGVRGFLAYLRKRIPSARIDAETESALNEMQDRRNFLTHRRGDADEQYRKRYDYQYKGKLIVTAEYLEDSFKTVEKVSNIIDSAVALLEETMAFEMPVQSNMSTVEFTVEWLVEEDARPLDSRFRFRLKDRQRGIRYVSLKSLIVSKREEGERTALLLHDSPEEIKGFASRLRSLARSGLLRIVERKHLTGPIRSRPLCNLDDEMVERIAENSRQPGPEQEV